MQRERLELEGIVIDSNKGKFKVEIDENMIVLCTLSGKIRQNSVRILVGDQVKIEVSEYDTSQGRIVYRIKGNWLILNCPICQEVLIVNNVNNFVCEKKDHLVIYYNNNDYVASKYSGNRAIGIRKENIQYRFFRSGQYPHSFDIDISSFKFEDSKKVLEKYMRLLPLL